MTMSKTTILYIVLCAPFSVWQASADVAGNAQALSPTQDSVANSVLNEMIAAWDTAATGAANLIDSQENVDLGEKLLRDIEVAFNQEGGNGEALRLAAQSELAELEAALKPILATLPSMKTRINSVAVRYALHKLFVRRHGWFVVGLDPEGQSWEKSSPADVVVLQKMPQAVRVVIEHRLQGAGLVSREVAVLAALLEHLVHQESSQRLHALYRALGWSTDAKNHAESNDKAHSAVEIFMANFVLGRDPSKFTGEALLQAHSQIQDIYPTWPKTKEFIENVFKADPSNATGGGGFLLASRVLDTIGERYGLFQNGECGHLKTTLMDVEDDGTGRVRLSNFYGMALHEKKWQFSESIPYLRQLGALDDSNPNNLRVIIPNYINGHSNCLASSEYYSVCCISECESIIQQLEQELKAPEAAPEQIAQLVAALPSSTVPAPRTLSSVMIRRLTQIATNYNGKVPFTSRLFAQWLHHAYPKECPYPHLSGTTSPQQIEEWMKGGVSPTASPEEMMKIAGVNSSYRKFNPSLVEEAHWSSEEELFVPTSVPMSEPPAAWLTVHLVVIAACAAITTFGFGLVRTARAGRKAMSAQTAANAEKLYPV